MKRWRAWLGLLTVLLNLASPVHAQARPVTADRETVEITGKVDAGALTASLRLTAEQEVGGLTLLVSDLSDVTGDGVARDPIPAAAFAVLPAAEWDQLPAGESIQVALQVEPRGEAGTWFGKLTVHWRRPAPGEFQLPLTLTVRNRPLLTVPAPGRVRVAGVRGQRISRTFLLQEAGNGVPATGIKIIRQDLANAGADHVLPARNLRIKTPGTELEGGAWMTVTATVDLGDVHSGEYAGDLLITDDHHNMVAVPVDVTVKDRGWWAASVLVAGVALGMGLSGYRARGRPRDRLTLRVAAVRERVKQESQFQVALSRPTARILAEAETALASGLWDEGNAAVERAEALVTRWRQDRASWAEQLERSQALRQRLQEMSSPAGLVQGLERQLSYLDLGSFETPRELDEALAQVEDDVARFQGVVDDLQQARQAVGQARLPAGVRQRWQVRVADLERRLSGLPPGDSMGLQGLEEASVALGRELQADIARHQELDDRKRAGIDAARPLLLKLGRPDSPLLSIANAANQVLRRVQGEEDWPAAADWAGNVWRGLWSAAEVLALAAGQPAVVVQTADVLRGWLASPSNYVQPTDAFRAALERQEGALQQALLAGNVEVVWPLEPVWPGVAVPKDLADASWLESPMGPRPMAAPPVEGVEEPVEPKDGSSGYLPGWVRSALEWLGRAFGPDVDASRLRLRLSRTITLVVALVLLSWVGYNELYAASPTFGANGPADYFALLVWGFGAETSRAAIAELVGGLT